MCTSKYFACFLVNRLYDGPDIKLFIFKLVCWGRSFLSVAWPTGVQLVLGSVSFSKVFCAQGSPSSDSLLNLLSPRFLFIRVIIMIYSFVLDDCLTS